MPPRSIGSFDAPDPRWHAYFSNESGAFELYLQPLARKVPPYRVSTTNERALARAREAVWARDGRELFYRHGSLMMSVRVPENEEHPRQQGLDRLIGERLRP